MEIIFSANKWKIQPSLAPLVGIENRIDSLTLVKKNSRTRKGKGKKEKFALISDQITLAKTVAAVLY